MNKYEHADTSARLFGGNSKEYEEFHSLIDSNKLVTPSIFGRFFLHHIDVGLPVVEQILGTHIGSLNVPTQSLFIQHLLEDYGCVPRFEKDWSNAFKGNIAKLPQLNDWNNFLENASNDLRIKSISANRLRALDYFFNIKSVTPLENTLEDPISYAIFGHALGADLVARLINKKFLFKNVYTLDVVVGYLNCRFKPVNHVDPVPTLLDWEKYIDDQSWMHAPERADKKATYYEDLYQMINEYDPKDEKYTVEFRLAKERKEFIVKVADSVRRNNMFFTRTPCNYD
mgnify:FL=1